MAKTYKGKGTLYFGGLEGEKIPLGKATEIDISGIELKVAGQIGVHPDPSVLYGMKQKLKAAFTVDKETIQQAFAGLGKSVMTATEAAKSFDNATKLLHNNAISKSHTEGENMAVTIKPKEDAHQLLKTLGVSEGLIYELKMQGISIEMTPNKMTFVKNGNPLSTLTVKAGVFSNAKAGILGQASKGVLQHKVSQAIEDAIKNVGGEVYSEDKLEPIPEAVVAKPTKTEPMPNLSGSAGIPSSMKKVKLRDATQMYQPVFGSGESSTYFCVAVSDLYKVAVRLTANCKLSFRVEPANGTTLPGAKELTIAGLEVHDGYASVHMDCGNTTMAHKAVGALLLALPGDFITPLPKVSILIGKGA